MRIVVYKDNITTGRGADRAVCDLCGYLCSTHDVTLLTQGAGTVAYALDPRVRIERIAVTASRHELRNTLMRLNPNRVVSTGVNEILNLARAFSAFPWPVLQQFHVYPPFAFKRKHWIRNILIRRAIRRCSAVQVLLPPFVESVRRTTGFKGPVPVIPNAGPAAVRREHTRSAADTDRVIVYPAALNAQKRQNLLIRALAEMRDADVRVELYGRGNPAYEKKLLRLAERLGVAARVAFRGYVADLSEAYAHASVVAFPSAAEGFGMVILEAAAYGRRVVACRDCLASATLVPPFDGVLSDPDPRAYARGLEAALANRMPPPQDALSTFAPTAIAAQWLRVIETGTSDNAN